MSIVFSKCKDSELIDFLIKKKGNENLAFNEIYTRYSSQLYTYCYLLYTDQVKAEETCQECWCAFFQSISNFKGKNNIYSILIGIVKRIYKNFYSQKIINNLQNDYINYNNLTDSADPFNFNLDFENKDLIEKIKIIINTMDEKYKEVLLMYWFEDMKIQQIAEKLNETTACIYKRFSRGYQLIIDLIKDLEKTKEF